MGGTEIAAILGGVAAIIGAIASLQSSIGKRMSKLEEALKSNAKENLEKHDEISRALTKIGDDVRLSVSAGVTSLDGLIQLGKSLNKPVNGPVVKMRDRCQDRIVDGIGNH